MIPSDTAKAAIAPRTARVGAITPIPRSPYLLLPGNRLHPDRPQSAAKFQDDPFRQKRSTRNSQTSASSNDRIERDSPGYSGAKSLGCGRRRASYYRGRLCRLARTEEMQCHEVVQEMIAAFVNINVGIRQRGRS